MLLNLSENKKTYHQIKQSTQAATDIHHVIQKGDKILLGVFTFEFTNINQNTKVINKTKEKLFYRWGSATLASLNNDNKFIRQMTSSNYGRYISV